MTKVFTLTPEEIATVEALRNGSAHVIPTQKSISATDDLNLPPKGIDLRTWIENEINTHRPNGTVIAKTKAIYIAMGAVLHAVADKTTLIMNLRKAGYTVAQAHPDAELFNFYAHLHRQRDWSSQTFGPGGRTAGVIDHIRKELVEIEADPSDIDEWIDVVILALDGAWRAGATPSEIIERLLRKTAKNEARQWPDWRTVDPNKAIEHDRSFD